MKILFVTPRLPYPPIKGDKSIILARIKYLAERGHSIDLISLIHKRDEIRYVEKLMPFCRSIKLVYHSKILKVINLIKSLFYIKTPIQTMFFNNKKAVKIIERLNTIKKYDIIWISTIRGLILVKNIKGYGKLVLEMIDSIAVNYENRLNFLPFFKRVIYKYELYRLKKQENAITDIVDKVIVVSNTETKYIKDLSKVSVIPISVNINSGKSSIKKYDLIFTGNLSYYPNYDAVFYFVDNILYKLLKKNINLKVAIVGSSPNKKLFNLCKRNRNIKIYKDVDNMYEYLQASKVAIVPLRIGSGMKFKILEAMANGIPVVTTKIGAQGISGLQDKHNILISNNINEFYNNVIKLLDDTLYYNYIKKEALQLVKRLYVDEIINNEVERIINDL